jgi:hypothetical protein
MTATYFDPYLDHHQAVFLNKSLLMERPKNGCIIVLIDKMLMIHAIL